MRLDRLKCSREAAAVRGGVKKAQPSQTDFASRTFSQWIRYLWDQRRVPENGVANKLDVA